MCIEQDAYVLCNVFLACIVSCLIAKGNDVMNSEEIEKRHECLVDAGFTQAQIELLSQFRSNYLEREKQQVSAQVRRLEFLRWLVATGRLTL